MHTGNQLKINSNKYMLAVAVMLCGTLSPLLAQPKHPTTPLQPLPVKPAAVAPRPAGTAAPPLPVVVELFVTGDDAANKAAQALLKTLHVKMPQENILTMSEHVARDKDGNVEPGAAPLVQRHFILHGKYRVNNLKAPLMLVDGTIPVLPLSEENVRKAIAVVRKENRQLVTVDAYISGKNLKINVFADYQRHVTDNCRIGAFVWANPVDPQEPVVRQVVDFGYLNSGHQGANTMVVPLDKSWYKPELYKQLNVVAVVHNCQTGKIIGASSCTVQKSKEGWF